MLLLTSLFSPRIQTDRPEQAVGPDQMQNVVEIFINIMIHLVF